MNKKIAFHIVALSFLVISAPSCKKWLNLQPQDGITRQEFWKTKEQIQSALIGCYSSLLADPNGVDRPLSEYLFMWGEIRADMVAPGIGISADEQNIMNDNILSNNTITNWASVYRTINYCNTVLDFAPGVLQIDNTLTQTQLNAWLAEARTLRALMYFYLVRSFRDVPLKLTSTSSDDDLIQLPKTSSDTVLKQILADLSFADSNAVVTHGSSYLDKGQITRYTVKAIEADVYLWMDNFPACIAACDYIINSGQFGLIAGNSAWYSTLYYTGNSNESIFEFQYDQQVLNSFYYIFTGSTTRYLAAATDIDDIYTIDYTNDQDKDIRADGASIRFSDNTIWKYIGVNSSTMRAANASYAHWIVYRYADILLMKAEALNQTGDGVDALALVYTVRARANALADTDLNPDPTDVNGVTDFIVAERAREFSFEGKRWYDILRNAKRNNYARLDIILTMVSKAVPGTLQQSAINKFRNYDSHYFPIYYYETQTDPNLVQNPFYK